MKCYVKLYYGGRVDLRRTSDQDYVGHKTVFCLLSVKSCVKCLVVLFYAGTMISELYVMLCKITLCWKCGFEKDFCSR